MTTGVVPARDDQSMPTRKRTRGDVARDAWDRFFFEPTSTATLAVVRITYGVLLTFWTISLGPDLGEFFTSTGHFPEHPVRENNIFAVFEYVTSDTFVVIVWAVLLVSAICLTIGFQTRLVAILCAVAVLSFQRRNPYVFNSGDLLVRQIPVYLMLAPAGVAMSMDRWLRDRQFWDFPRRAQWPLRLLQIEVSLGYLWSVWAKVRGTMWNDGTALNYALQIVDLNRVPVPGFVFDNLILLNLMTYGTLVAELALAIFIWNRKLRPYVLVVGVLLHLSIDLTITVGFFSFAMFVAYLAFVPGDTMESFLGRLRERRARRRAATA